MTTQKEIYDAIRIGTMLLGEMEQKMGYIHDTIVELMNENKDKLVDNVIDIDEKGVRIRDDFAPYLSQNDCYIDFIYIDNDGKVRCFCGDWCDGRLLSDFINTGEVTYILEGLNDELNAREGEHEL